MNFLTSVSERKQNMELFSGEGVLKAICEQVIVPNMYFREPDEENFETNPEEYIRRDIEGSGKLTLGQCCVLWCVCVVCCACVHVSGGGTRRKSETKQEAKGE